MNMVYSVRRNCFSSISVLALAFAASRGFAGAPPSSTTMVWDDATKTLTVADPSFTGDYYL